MVNNVCVLVCLCVCVCVCVCVIMPPTSKKLEGHIASCFLKLCVKVFSTSLFPNPLMDFVNLWYDDRYWSKILCCTIHTPVLDLKIKVTDIEFLC